MCVGCEGLDGSDAIRAAFAAVRGKTNAPCDFNRGMDPFGRRVRVVGSTLPTKTQRSPEQSLKRKRQSTNAEIAPLVMPAPSMWWEVPWRMATCYLVQYHHSRLSIDPTASGKLTAQLALNEQLSPPKYGGGSDSESGAARQTAGAKKPSPLTPTEAAAAATIPRVMDAHEYWDFI